MSNDTARTPATIIDEVHPWLNARTYESTSTRTVVEFDLEAVEAVLNVNQILAIYKVGDSIQVITESA